LVVAVAQVGQQGGGEVVGAGGQGRLDGGLGLAEDVADLSGPGLLGGVQVQHGLAVAEQVGLMPISA
jgi:hypothetical protein